MSDLRESGAIEQDADIILFIYREYDMTDTSVEPDKRDKVELIIAKHRNGEPGSVDMRWQGKYTSFVDIDNSAATLAVQAPPTENTGTFDGAEEVVRTETSASEILAGSDTGDGNLDY